MKIFVIVLAFFTLLVSCKNESHIDDYVSISGKVSNAKNNLISIANRNSKKELTIDANGNFSDTLKVTEGAYVFLNGKERAIIHLKNGYNLSVEYDAENFTNSLIFAGLGAGTNNFLAANNRLQESPDYADFNSLFILDKPAFDEKVSRLKNKLDNLVLNAQDLDSTVMASTQQSNQQLIKFLVTRYQDKHDLLVTLGKGKPSPKFNYPDINGKNISLDDLKGKYVYIDVWATWCGPCKVQIPYLKEIEETYKDKNIAFVGLSIDTQKNKDKWKKMVGERGLKGYQLLSDNDWKSTFVEEYKISGIPRFILIDPEGNIVSADAPRPSEPALITLFNELKI
jgi:thiol-disulfide isomerase/thioredoxin